jgi:peptidoglycan/LPS O-acetylase OafA/YrhL
MPWRAGVDIFFVISGFIVVHAARPLFGTPDGPGGFLRRRLIRIVPLYWALTTLFLLLVVAGPRGGPIKASLGGPLYVAASYLFIPCARPDGLVEPVLGLGWTLQFEMLFYLLLTPCLRLARPAAIAVTTLLLAALVGAVHLGLLGGVVLGTWGDPLVFEFCAGMALSLLSDRITMPGWLRAALIIAAVTSLHLTGDRAPHALVFGGPATLLVAAATLGPDRRRPAIERGLERLGDASYAFYLFHPFVMRPASLIWKRLGHAHPGLAAPAALVVLAVAECAALLIHHWFERPVTGMLRRSMTTDRQGATR